jgi:hypothetical protein
MVLKLDVCESVAVRGPVALFKGVEVAGGVSLRWSLLANQAAQIDEVLVGTGSLAAFAGRPLVDEAVRVHDGIIALVPLPSHRWVARSAGAHVDTLANVRLQLDD